MVLVGWVVGSFMGGMEFIFSFSLLRKEKQYRAPWISPFCAFYFPTDTVYDFASWIRSFLGGICLVRFRFGSLLSDPYEASIAPAIPQHAICVLGSLTHIAPLDLPNGFLPWFILGWEQRFQTLGAAGIARLEGRDILLGRIIVLGPVCAAGEYDEPRAVGL